MRITAKHTDITALLIDAIVNAANNALANGSGVNGTIHRAAGPKLAEYCSKLSGCKTGQAIITPGFKLPAKYIIHTVGPIWQDGNHNESQLLISCYSNCLKLASDKEDIKSIAFPLISTGIFGYPLEEGINIAISTLLKEAHNSDIEEITIACFDKTALDICHRLL